VSESTSFSLPATRAILQNGPHRLRALVDGLPSNLLHANEGPGTWSPHQVIGHIVYAERADWIPRLLIALDGGGDGEFEPFDRQAQERLFADTPISDLLDELTTRRADNLRVLDERVHGPAELSTTAMHPELGRVTVAQLLSTWALHDWGHCVQISRIIAKSYRDSVGPWARYFSVLSS
jgi:hypothetical protein